MSKNALVGVAPQKLATDAAGVSLTRSQSTFLRVLLHLFKHREDEKEKDLQNALLRAGERIGLSRAETLYIKEWVVCRGLHWMTVEKIGLKQGELEQRKAFRNPLVRRLINVMSERGVCVGTVASKEELADFYTQRIRSEWMPEVLRESAAVNLAKLMGYNPDDGNGGGGTVNVQINCVNPYGEVVGNG